jgi:transposase
MERVLDDLPDDVEALRAALRLAYQRNQELEAREQAKAAEATRLTQVVIRQREEKAQILTANTALGDQIAALKLINLRLEKLLSRYERLRYGPTSEKLNPDQLQLALEEIEQAVAAAEAEAEKLKPDLDRKTKCARRRGVQRPSLPSHLPEVNVTLEPENLACPCCSGALHAFDEDVSRRLDVIPTQYQVIVTHRPKYTCQSCKDVLVQAPAPAHVIEGGLPTEALIAQVLVAKHADHNPFYRQMQAMARQGIEIHRSVLASWGGVGACELKPIYAAMNRELMSSSVLFVDETTIPVLDPGRGRTKTTYFWSVLRDQSGWDGPDPRVIIYNYAPGRGAKHAETFLQGFTGTIQVDGYQAYKSIARDPERGLRLAHCWAHCRRDYHDLYKPDGSTPIAQEALRQIAGFYAIEAEIRGRPAQERQRVRQERTRPLVEAFKVWVKDRLAEIMSSSLMAEPLNYTLSHWEGLTVFLEDGRVEIDSNPVERSMKPIILTRKNSLFAGTEDGAENWSVIASIVETCKFHGVDPQRYLTDVLTKLANQWPNRRISELLPWIWKKQNAVAAQAA